MDVTVAETSPATEVKPAAPIEQPAPQAEAKPEAPKEPEAKPEQKPEEKPEEKKDDKFSSKFAALARRERQILAREVKAKELEAKFSNYDKLDTEIRSNPLKYLQDKFGITYTDLTQMALNEGKPTPEHKLKEVEARLSEWERRQQEEADRKQKEAEEKQKSDEQAKYKAVLDGFVKQIGDFIETNAEAYELTKAHSEGSALVYNVIDAHNAKTGRLMSIEEATKHVESYLEEEAKKLLSLNKLKPKADPAKEASKETAPRSSAPTTLTNSAQTDVPTPQERPLTVDESLERAAKLLKWTS